MLDRECREAQHDEEARPFGSFLSSAIRDAGSAAMTMRWISLVPS